MYSLGSQFYDMSSPEHWSVSEERIRKSILYNGLANSLPFYQSCVSYACNKVSVITFFVTMSLNSSGRWKYFTVQECFLIKGWRQIQSIVVGKPEEIITVQEIIKGTYINLIYNS